MMFKSVVDVQERLQDVGYITSRRSPPFSVTGKPFSSKGLPGSARLSKGGIRAFDCELIRLQAEGLDSKALYEWGYAKQLLYTQMVQGRSRYHNRCGICRAVDRIAEQEDILLGGS